MKEAWNANRAISRLALLLLALVVISWINATNFDWTEGKTISQWLLVAIGTELGVKVFSGGKPKDGNNDG